MQPEKKKNEAKIPKYSTLKGNNATTMHTQIRFIVADILIIFSFKASAQYVHNVAPSEYEKNINIIIIPITERIVGKFKREETPSKVKSIDKKKTPDNIRDFLPYFLSNGIEHKLDIIKTVPIINVNILDMKIPLPNF